MKKIYIFLCITIASLTQLQAQAPQGFNYQATVRNSSGDLIINTNVYFKFNVIQGSETAVPIFTETHYVPTDDLGQVNLVIGQGTPNTGVFSELDWSQGSYYLGIELDTGSGYVAMGTTQLLSVPYAMYAETSGNATSTTPNLQSVLTENNSAGQQQIKNLLDPTDGSDAVTKSYVDALSGSQGLMNFNGWDNYQISNDNSTFQLEPNSFLFLNADETTLILPQDGNYGDVVYIYVVRPAGIGRKLYLQPNGTPYAYVDYDFNLFINDTETVYGTFGHGTLQILFKTNDYWMCSNFQELNPNDTDSDGDGYSLNQGDCDDANAQVNPGATEIEDGIDNDCDGEVDEGFDIDGDGYTVGQGDCDDYDASINPGATEIEDGIDNDCDGEVDEGFDIDGDGYTVGQGDCDDYDASINPGATEIEDGIDNDCDGEVDEGFDIDGDGYTVGQGDCDDYDASINPGATEIEDGIDNDCDGEVDEGFDIDGDGYTVGQGDCDDYDASINPGATEIEDGIDNDCDGEIDEGFEDSGTVDDIDGNSYDYLTYGDQVWTVENAEMVTYRDGTPIPQVTDDTEWEALTTGAWSYINNDPTKEKVYNWYAVMGVYDATSLTDPSLRKEFAPEGWHVPSDDEWTTLENYLITNGYNYDGSTSDEKIAKAMASSNDWNSSNTIGAVGYEQNTNNSSEFNAYPNGLREGYGAFNFIGRSSVFWTSTQLDSNSARNRDIYYNRGYIENYSAFLNYGFSVRFVRD